MTARLAWPSKPSRPGWRLYAHHLGDYMLRYILQTPWFDLRLHRILRSDEAYGLHDHPWDFTSLLLTAGYTEILPLDQADPCGPSRAVWHPWLSVVRHRAEDAHRVLVDRPVWTLCWTSPRRRPWGFWAGGRWLPWQEARELWAAEGHASSAQILKAKELQKHGTSSHPGEAS